MYQEILVKNSDFIKNQKIYHPITEATSLAVNSLNSKNIITVSGLRHTGRTKLIHDILKKTQSFETTFYYNSDIDTLGVIKTERDLITLLDIYIRIHGIPKIICLQNSNNIEGIKSFISQLIKTKKYKIIIVGNNIKIDGVEDIELFPLSVQDIDVSLLQYGGISEVRIVPDTHYKNFVLQALKHDIVTREILEAYTIKNISLFYRVISYLSECSVYQSLREIHRNLESHGIDISLLTMIDYINAGINTKLLSRCYLYDIKNKNTIESKGKYFFGDVGIRTAFSEKFHPLENTIYIELLKKGYSVQGGLNGRFQCSFYAVQEKQVIIIHIESSQDKNEIRKTARKLGKIVGNSRKFIVVESKENLGMRKFEEEGVKIVELQELLKILS